MLLTDLERDGFVVLPAGATPITEHAQPWTFVDKLLPDSQPIMIERQVIRPVPQGRTFASSQADTPLHNDLQLFCGRPADLQIMLCLRQASQGGESLLVDTHALVRDWAASDPRFGWQLFALVRRFPFVSGLIDRPTLSLFGEHLVFLHAPRPSQGPDPIFARVAELAARSARQFRLSEGQVLIADNHRMLHGRAAFHDTQRELVRFLVWLDAPRKVDTNLVEAARQARSKAIAAKEQWACEPAPKPDKQAMRELGILMRMLAGGSPGALAAKSGMLEPELYAIRDRALSAALEALRRKP